jgi:hypothetical protein
MLSIPACTVAGISGSQPAADAMQTKDCIYLSLIGLAGVVFYVHGYLRGTRRGRRAQPEGASVRKQAELLYEDPSMASTSQPLFFFRGATTLVRVQGRGVFGKN